MSCFELEPLPLSKILAEVRDLIESGYDPLHYLSQFYISDQGGRLRKQ